MNTSAQINQKLIVAAIVFGVLALGISYVLFHFSFLASLVIGIIVGVIAALIWMKAWHAEEPQAPATPAPAPAPKPVAAPAPAPKTPAAPAAPAAPATPEVAAAESSTPEFLSEARDGGPDDLKQIKGVGPKLEKTLHEMGIFHFDQIAEWGPKEQSWMDDNLNGFKGRATRDNWVAQAKALAGK